MLRWRAGGRRDAFWASRIGGCSMAERVMLVVVLL